MTKEQREAYKLHRLKIEKALTESLDMLLMRQQYATETLQEEVRDIIRKELSTNAPNVSLRVFFDSVTEGGITCGEKIAKTIVDVLTSEVRAINCINFKSEYERHEYFFEEIKNSLKGVIFKISDLRTRVVVTPKEFTITFFNFEAKDQ